MTPVLAAVARATKRQATPLCALGLFALLVAVYMANGYTAGNNDATGSVRLALQLARHGRLTFTPEDSPFMDASAPRAARYDDRPSAEQHALIRGGSVQARELNIDRPEYRYRLWSVSDNPILYYVRRWSSVRAQRQQDVVAFMRDDG